MGRGRLLPTGLVNSSSTFGDLTNAEYRSFSTLKVDEDTVVFDDVEGSEKALINSAYISASKARTPPPAWTGISKKPSRRSRVQGMIIPNLRQTVSKGRDGGIHLLITIANRERSVLLRRKG